MWRKKIDNPICETNNTEINGPKIAEKFREIGEKNLPKITVFPTHTIWANNHANILMLKKFDEISFFLPKNTCPIRFFFWF